MARFATLTSIPPLSRIFVFGIAIAVLTTALTSREIFAQETTGSASFVNDVVPLLTKAGCNSGVCHAKVGNGQNGFQLSLLGFEPKEDFETIAKVSRGRRLSSADPESSLLLMKATAKLSHGGGTRFAESTSEYSVLLDWIRNGAIYDADSAPKLLSVEVQPNRASVKPETQKQLKVIATYSNQLQHDVTRAALFETNDTAMADVTSHGLVQVHNLPGKVSIMVRFQGKVSVFNASVPLGAATNALPSARNFVDDAVFANLKELGIPPSPLKPEALEYAMPAIAADEDPRLKLADWMSSPNNACFAKAVVNRYWKHFFRRGLIEPEDDIRDTNPPSNPELLAALEKHLIDSGFRKRKCMRMRTYPIL